MNCSSLEFTCSQTLIFLKMVRKVNGRVEIGLREFYINKEAKIEDFEYLGLLLIKYVNFCYLKYNSMRKNGNKPSHFQCDGSNWSASCLSWTNCSVAKWYYLVVLWSEFGPF